MVRHKWFIAFLLWLALLVPVRADSVTFVYIWQYPRGYTVDPANVTVELTGGTITQTDITERGGVLVFTNEYGRACYRVTIHAGGRIYTGGRSDECFTVALPAVIANG